MKSDIFALPDYSALLKGMHTVLLNCEHTYVDAISELFCAQGAIVYSQPFADADILIYGIESDKDSCAYTAFQGASKAVQSVIGHMQQQCAGTIVFIGSSYGDYSVPDKICSTVASASIEGYARALAMQYAKYNIRANCITVPFPSNREHLMQLLPRDGTAQDVANAALFLASSMSSFMTGQTLPVNGGGYRIGHNQVWTGK